MEEKRPYEQIVAEHREGVLKNRKKETVFHNSYIEYKNDGAKIQEIKASQHRLRADGTNYGAAVYVTGLIPSEKEFYKRILGPLDDLSEGEYYELQMKYQHDYIKVLTMQYSFIQMMNDELAEKLNNMYASCKSLSETMIEGGFITREKAVLDYKIFLEEVVALGRSLLAEHDRMRNDFEEYGDR